MSAYISLTVSFLALPLLSKIFSHIFLSDGLKLTFVFEF